MQIGINFNGHVIEDVTAIRNMCDALLVAIKTSKPDANAPSASTPAAVDDRPAFLKNQPAPAATEKPAADALEGAKAPKGGRSKKEAPAPVAGAAPAAATTDDGLTLEIVRARLSDYSADKRYGMEGVLARLKDFSIERISDLPKARFAEFKAVLDEALAKPAVDPLA